MRASPNPTPGELALELAVPGVERVRVSLHDPQGREVVVLFDGVVSSGRQIVTWNGVAGDHRLANGLYLLRADIGGTRLTRRIAVIR